MASNKMPPKDPDAVLPYAEDWTAWLVAEENDTIVDSTWTANNAAMTIESSTFAAGITVVWLSGGTAGKEYTVTNHIVTASGREDDRSIIVPVKER